VCKLIVGQEEEELKDQVTLAVFSVSYPLLVDFGTVRYRQSFWTEGRRATPRVGHTSESTFVSLDVSPFSSGTR